MVIYHVKLPHFLTGLNTLTIHEGQEVVYLSAAQMHVLLKALPQDTGMPCQGNLRNAPLWLLSNSGLRRDYFGLIPCLFVVSVVVGRVLRPSDCLGVLSV